MANMANGSRYDFSIFVKGGRLDRILNTARLAIEDLIEKHGAAAWHYNVVTELCGIANELPVVDDETSCLLVSRIVQGIRRDGPEDERPAPSPSCLPELPCPKAEMEHRSAAQTNGFTGIDPSP
jgi:hypothetical protein